MGKGFSTAESRFWKYVNKTDGCWLWTATPTSMGYGRLVEWVDGRRREVFAHRLSYKIAYGPFDESLCICHKCDTPLCVKPDHLFLGTQTENLADMTRKGRRRFGPRSGENNGNARLSAEDARQIRELSVTGQSYAAIARRFGISDTHARRVVKGQQWRTEVGCGVD